MNTLIQVKSVKRMGRVDLYPANELAEKICALLGKRNLPHDAIVKLREMGYTIEGDL